MDWLNVAKILFNYSFWAVIGIKYHIKNIKYCDNEHLKLQTCSMKQKHHKNVEIFPCR
jgi:hypothetical protein